MIYLQNTYVKLTMNDGVTSFVVYPRDILKIDDTASLDYQKNTEMLTGVSSPNTCSISFAKVSATANADLNAFLSRAASWRMVKLELFYTEDGSQNFKKLFDGLIFVRAENRVAVTFSARGYLDLLNITMVETPLLKNRKVATYIPDATTTSEKAVALLTQDPTIETGEKTGIINALMWLIGGRPHKYKSLYTSSPQHSSVAGYYPKFYYDCSPSIINPEWVWFDYENLFSDLNDLCKASAGFLKQDLDGVIRYENIYNFKKDFNGITLTDSNYTNLEIGEETTEPYNKIIVNFTPRYLASSQEIFSEVLEEYLEGNQEFSNQISFNKPTYNISTKAASGQLLDSIVTDTYLVAKDIVSCTDSFGTKRNVSFKVIPHKTLYISKYIYNKNLGAIQKVRNTAVLSSKSSTIFIKNDQATDLPTLYLTDLTLVGRALESTSQKKYISQLNQYTTISGYKTLTIPDNPYTQSMSQAVRINNIANYLQATPRRSIQLSDVPYTSGITLGATIYVDSVSSDVSGYFKIGSISFNTTLAATNLALVAVDDLKTMDNLFIVSKTYLNTDTRYLSF
jgi:hypothetical protein